MPACFGECGGGSTSSGEGRVCALVGVPKPWFPCVMNGACRRWWAVAIHIRRGREKCQWSNGRTCCTIALRGGGIFTKNGGGDWRNSGGKLLIPYSQPLFDHRFEGGMMN